MITRIKEKISIPFIISFIMVFSLFMAFLPNHIGQDNIIYGIGHYQLFDTTLFQNNVYMANGVISPRFAVDYIVVFLMKFFSLSWESTIVFLLYSGIFLLSIATALLAHRLTKRYENSVTLMLAFAIILDVTHQVGGFSLFLMQDVGMNFGYALVIMAIAFSLGERPNFNFAWLLTGIAALMHIHEGIYGFAIVFLFALTDSIKNRRVHVKEQLMLFISMLLILSIVIPNMMTDTLNISSEEFTFIYADYRHPHHLVPSTWSKKGIIFSFILLCYPAIFRIEQLYFDKDKNEIIDFFVESAIFIGSWILAFGCLYLGLEKLKSASIATLFVTKYFKFIGFIAVTWYLKIIVGYLNEQKFLQGIFVFLFMLLAIRVRESSICLFTAIAAFLYFDGLHEKIAKKNIVYDKILKRIMVVTSILLFTFFTSKSVSIIFVFICICGLFYLITKKTQYFLVSLLFVVPLCFYGKAYTFKNHSIAKRTAVDFVKAACGDDIFDISKEFELSTEKTDSFIADPADDNACGWMQILSKRNCFVVNKVIPSSKKNDERMV